MSGRQGDQTILTEHDDGFRQRFRTERDGDAGGWEWAGTGRPLPWLGIVLVLIGAAVLVRQLAPGVSFTSLFLLALAVAFGAAWLIGRARWALVPSLILLGIALGRLLSELGIVRGDGWTTLLVGIALLLIWLIGRLQGIDRAWAALIGGLLTVFGAIQVSGQIPGLPDLGIVWPILIIGAGILLIAGGRLGFGSRRTS